MKTVDESDYKLIEVPLSPREKRLLRRLAQGLPDTSIATQLGGTVKQVAEQRAIAAQAPASFSSGNR